MAIEEFVDRIETAMRDLFIRAQAANELHFAMALFGEFRGLQDPGWNTAQESVRAFDQFKELLDKLPLKTPIRARVALCFYAHVSEGAGFYEIPKKLLLTIEGNGNNMYPFATLVEKHKRTGEIIAPNANKIIQDLIGHSKELNLDDLALIWRDAFDADLRNAIAHADYVIWSDGIRLPKRNGGFVKVYSWDEFSDVFLRAINVFHVIRVLTNEFQSTYANPKIVKARLTSNSPLEDWTIHNDMQAGTFGISSGPAKSNN